LPVFVPYRHGALPLWYLRDGVPFCEEVVVVVVQGRRCRKKSGRDGEVGSNEQGDSHVTTGFDRGGAPHRVQTTWLTNNLSIACHGVSTDTWERVRSVGYLRGTYSPSQVVSECKYLFVPRSVKNAHALTGFLYGSSLSCAQMRSKPNGRDAPALWVHPGGHLQKVGRLGRYDRCRENPRPLGPGPAWLCRSKEAPTSPRCSRTALE
jgi:hypothetical protein